MLSSILLKLTLEGALAAVPHDVAAVTVYVLLGAFVGFVWAGSRTRAPREPTTPNREIDDR